MKTRFINEYTVNDLKNPGVKEELAECLKAPLYDVSVSFSMDQNDPAGSLAAMAAEYGQEQNLRVFHCCFEPEEHTLEEANSWTELCNEIAAQATHACGGISMVVPIAVAVHSSDDFRVDAVFGNVSNRDGSLEEGLVEELTENLIGIA